MVGLDFYYIPGLGLIGSALVHENAFRYPSSAPSVDDQAAGVVVPTCSTVMGDRDGELEADCLVRGMMVLDRTSMSRLNRSFEFECVRRADIPVVMSPFFRDRRYVSVVASHEVIVAGFFYFSRVSLASIARFHGVAVGSKSKPMLQRDVLLHVCSDCPGAVYVFRSLDRDRRSIKVRKPVTVGDLTTLLERRVLEASRLKGERRAAGDAASISLSRERHNIAQRERREVGYEGRAGARADMMDHASQSFPVIPGDEERNSVIRRWQDVMEEGMWVQMVCAVCGQRAVAGGVTRVSSLDLDLTLLQNSFLPDHVLPNSYNFEAYDKAILCSAGLYDKGSRGDMDVCASCRNCLMDKGIQPINSLANFQYYGYERLHGAVAEAFNKASMFELMLVSRCRATRITYMYSEKPGVRTESPELSQRFTRGNVAIIPQDSVQVRPLLPPGRDEIRDAVCALFVGGSTVPTVSNIESLHPVLVSKSRVFSMIDFLITNNPWYSAGGAAFSRANFDDLFHPRDNGKDRAVLRSVELGHLPRDMAADVGSGNADYTDRGGTDGVSDEVIDGADNIIVEAVGYTQGDHTPQNYRQMKAVALAWCLDRKKYIRVRGAMSLLDSKHPGLLPFLFPHLDPWGIGGFHNELRTPEQYISFPQQVKNMLNQRDSPFEKDPNFAFVCWNLIQRLEINKSMCFRIPRGVQRTLAQDLKEIGPELSNIILRWHCDPSASPVTEVEKRAMFVMNRIKLVAVDLRGSSGYKLCRRNEIRSLTRVLSTPALFITINPADVMNPLMGVLGGIPVDRWRSMSKDERLLFVADHPGVAARFFDIVIRSFIDIILCPRKPGGYFGYCTGYYGMVEAQGKGTLHFHLVVYLAGNPNPQELRERMCSDPLFKIRMFSWLEAIISCELPGMSEPLVSTAAEPVKKPVRPQGILDPRMQSAPTLKDMSEEAFQIEFKRFVAELAVTCNWHDHKDTCWKHLKDGEKRSDASCRMGIDGSTRAVTELDEETLSIMLRRLHPRINNFNELVLFLLRCNMDIKYIGSGQAAKALVYYVTDYITKSTLTAHAGLDALLYAIRAYNKTIVRDVEADVYKTTEAKERGLLIKSVNAMMARQEMSHQQVMSYLVGGGDHYTSHQFRTLRWHDFSRFMFGEERDRFRDQDEEDEDGRTQHNPETQASRADTVGTSLREGNNIRDVGESLRANGECTGSDSDVDDGEEEGRRYFDNDGNNQEDLFLAGEGCLEISSQVLDYRYRPLEPEFDSLSVWEFVASSEIIGLKAEEERLNRRAGQTSNRGRRPSPRGRFSSNEHPKITTHLMRLRVDPVVPVLLGPNVSRPDGTDAQYKTWCRSMLILFKPWRKLGDLLGTAGDWVAAYEEYVFPPAIAGIIRNFGVERQCKDARDEYREMRRRGAVKSGLISGLDVEDLEGDGDSLDVALVNDARLDNFLELTDQDEEMMLDDVDMSQDKSPADESVRILDRVGLFAGDSENCGEAIDPARLVGERDRELLALQTKSMVQLRNNKRPRARDDDDEGDEYDPNDSRIVWRKRMEQPGGISIDRLGEINGVGSSSMSVSDFCATALQTVIDLRKLAGNPEQERAFRIVGEHMNGKGGEQLMMYVGGPAGTGKSYVINAIVDLFQRCGRSDELLLSAPTGCAAVLIGGYTVHAITMLPRRKDRDQKWGYQQLVDIWKNVKYLIIDEVSMISALFLSQVSERICQAKSWDPNQADKPFGGVNIIYFGDLGQLKPVRALALFSHSLVKKLTPHIAQNPSGQSALHGAFLWRSVNRVVLLKKNMRSYGDPGYTALLERLRLGNSLQVRSTDASMTVPGDYDVLLNRTISAMNSLGVDCAAKFRGAPIISPVKAIRDAVNERVLKAHAASLGQVVHCYRSKDRHLGKPASGEQMERLWRIRSSHSKDSLGLLHLFVGMEVMVTDNVAISQKVVNGSRGVVVDVLYDVDGAGYRYATCVYVRIEGSGVQAPGLAVDVVPILPVITYFKYISSDGVEFAISRKQVPLLPAYAMTDYKSQGQSMQTGIVDLQGGWTVQSLYVMLSRMRTLDGLGILRWFPPNKLQQRLSGEFRAEFERLDNLHVQTEHWFRQRQQVP